MKYYCNKCNMALIPYKEYYRCIKCGDIYQKTFENGLYIYTKQIQSKHCKCGAVRAKNKATGFYNDLCGGCMIEGVK